MSVGLIRSILPTITQLSASISPQHFKSPLSRMAQVCWVPEDSATAVRPVPRSIAVLEGASVFAGLDEVHVGHHRPPVHIGPIPNTSRHRCQDGASVAISSREFVVRINKGWNSKSQCLSRCLSRRSLSAGVPRVVTRNENRCVESALSGANAQPVGISPAHHRTVVERRNCGVAAATATAVRPERD